MNRKRRIQWHPRGQYVVRIRRNGIAKNFFLGSNKKKAEDKLAEVERDVASGAIQFAAQETSQVVRTDGSTDVRVEELAVRHLEWVKANRARNTFLLRQHYVSLFVQHVGACMVSDLTPKLVEQFYAACRNRKAKKGAPPRRCVHAVREIRAMFRWGDEHDICLNPIRRWPQAPNVPPPTRYFSPDDLDKLLLAVPADLADMLIFGTLTGLRPQELRTLQRANIVRGETGRLFVRIEHHKTSASSKVPVPRTVPLSAEAAEIAQRQMDAHPKSDFVFLNDDGHPYKAIGFRQRLQRWCTRAGVPVMPPYALRHVFGTRQASNGTNQAILAQLMGHSNLQTAARYVVNCDDAHLKAVDALAESVMSGRKPTLRVLSIAS